MDSQKMDMAAKIIAGQIAKIPANTPMAYGTVGAAQGMAEREGEAFSMAKYFVTQMGGKFSGSLPEKWSDEVRESVETAQRIAALAITEAGK